MTDLVGRIHVEQAQVAQNIAIKLFSESRYVLDLDLFKPRESNGEVMEVDDEVVEILYKSELKASATNSIMGYTDWLIFGRMLPVTGFDTQPLPQDSEINYDSISVKRSVPPNLLCRVVEELHKQDKIPLIGEVRNNFLEGRYLIPDKQTIREYVSLFDATTIKHQPHYQSLFQ